jgi:hypothetical protein
MSERRLYVADALRELRRIANQFVTADPPGLAGPDGAVLRLCDIPDDIAAAIQEVRLDKDGRLQGVVLVDKARAARLLLRMTEAADSLPREDQEQGHGRWQH